MQKVLIADDEVKICQLIEKLVDWAAIDMEIVAMAYNGLEAFEKIQKYQPDIVITDIRMPGMDGLEIIQKTREKNRSTEFIIISGYRHFGYAQSAIRYGVHDYLLKPIKKEELICTLVKMHEAYLQKTEQLTFEEKVLMALKNDEGKIRTSFFSSLLYPKTRVQMQSLEQLNQDYHYHFQAGLFQVISIKLDGVGEVYNNQLEFLTEKIISCIHTNLKEVCYDLELYFENSRSYCLLNYQQGDKKSIRKGLKNALSEMIQQKNILEKLQVTFGCGIVTSSLNNIQDSIRSAIRATEDRLLLGTERLIEERTGSAEKITDSDMFRDFNRKMNQALENLDVDLVSRLLEQLKQDLISIDGITGHEVLQMTKEVCNLFLLTMRNYQLTIEDGDYFLENFNIQANGYHQMGDLFQYLKQKILVSLEQVAEEKKQMDKKPIRLAKKYIQEHYNQPITLELVSEEAGFNATYFSSLFKKETGVTFVEYVLDVRMEHAKRLLRDTNDNVAVICEKVGYSDVKHFTKNFVKHCNLKPNEYRKLYS